MKALSKSTSCQRSPRNSDTLRPPSAETIRSGLKSSSAASINARIASTPTVAAVPGTMDGKKVGAEIIVRFESIVGTPAETYLRSRGFTTTPPDCIQYHRFSDVTKRYLDERTPHLAARNAADQHTIMGKLVEPDRGKKLVTEITKVDVEKLQTKIAAGRAQPSKANNRTHKLQGAEPMPVRANRVAKLSLDLSSGIPASTREHRRVGCPWRAERRDRDQRRWRLDRSPRPVRHLQSDGLTVEVAGSIDGTNWALLAVRSISGGTHLAAVAGTAAGSWVASADSALPSC